MPVSLALTLTSALTIGGGCGALGGFPGAVGGEQGVQSTAEQRGGPWVLQG